jgi:hypothetical protein
MLIQQALPHSSFVREYGWQHSKSMLFEDLVQESVRINSWIEKMVLFI